MRVYDDYQDPLAAIVRFDFADLTTAVGVPAHLLPPGGIVIGGAVVVETAWDSGTSATLKVGDDDDDDRYTASAVDITETGRTALTLTGYKYDTPTELELLLTEVGTAATEGEGYIELTIVMEGRTNEAVS